MITKLVSRGLTTTSSQGGRLILETWQNQGILQYRLGKISEKGPRKSAEGIFMYKLGTTFS